MAEAPLAFKFSDMFASSFPMRFSQRQNKASKLYCTIIRIEYEKYVTTGNWQVGQKINLRLTVDPQSYFRSRYPAVVAVSLSKCNICRELSEDVMSQPSYNADFVPYLAMLHVNVLVGQKRFSQ